jgi:hypothetical protein
MAQMMSGDAARGLPEKVLSESVRRSNVRTGVLLGLLAFALFLGFLAKFAFLR